MILLFLLTQTQDDYIESLHGKTAGLIPLTPI